MITHTEISLPLAHLSFIALLYCYQSAVTTVLACKIKCLFISISTKFYVSLCSLQNDAERLDGIFSSVIEANVLCVST